MSSEFESDRLPMYSGANSGANSGAHYIGGISLPDKPVRGPHPLGIAIRCIHEFHVMSLRPQYAKPRILWRGKAFEALEVLLHFLAFAGLRVLIGRIEFIF